MLTKRLFVYFAIVTVCPIAYADDVFTDGPAITGYGKTAVVADATPLDANQKFKVVFDVGTQNAKGEVNRGFDGLARFINLHVKAGVKQENIDLALVVHGKAAYDLLSQEAFQAKFSAKNPNFELLKKLMDNRVEIYLCGQTATYYEIKKDQLLNGVQLSWSAMTAHALLQQDEYTLNPF